MQITVHFSRDEVVEMIQHDDDFPWTQEQVDVMVDFATMQAFPVEVHNLDELANAPTVAYVSGLQPFMHGLYDIVRSLDVRYAQFTTNA